MAKNYYDILGVSMDAPTSDIQQAYWRHEDELRRQGIDSSDARFQEVRTAYEMLSSFLKRREYDEQLKQAESSPPSDQPETLDEVRVELADLLGKASSPAIMDSWQSAPEPVTTVTSSMDDKDLIADVDAELDALFKEAQNAKKVESYDDDDPFAQMSAPQARKSTPHPLSGGLQARRVTPQKKSSQSRARALVLVAVLLVGIASVAVFALIPVDEATNTTSTGNFSSSSSSLPTRAPLATSTSQQVAVIERLEEQGDESFADGDYSQAVTRYTQAISRGASAQLYYKRAQAFWSARELMEDREVTNALGDLDTAIEWDANYHDAYQLRGLIYYELWVAFGVEDDALQAIDSLNTYIDQIGVSADPPRAVTVAIRELEAR